MSKLTPTAVLSGVIAIASGGGGGSESSDFVVHHDIEEIADYMFCNQNFKSFKVESDEQPVYVGSYCLANCLSLERIEFPLVSTFGTTPFAGSPIRDYYIGRSAKAATGQSAVVPFGGFNIGAFVQGAKIHVPSDLIYYYRDTTGWRSYASMIVGDYDA